MFAQGPATRDRFLAAIAERVSPDRMQAVFLFPPIRSGTVETGVAVLAVDPLPPAPVEVAAEDSGSLFEAVEEEREGGTDEVVEAEGVAVTEASGDAAAEDVATEPIAATTASAEGEQDEAEQDEAEQDEPEQEPPLEGADARSPRPLVLTARYRHTLKGPDRGKWFVEVHEQADAPLATVEMVVAGVTQRHDDAVEPEHLDAEAVRAAVSAGTWTTATR
jgi:hypothetical protein